MFRRAVTARYFVLATAGLAALIHAGAASAERLGPAGGTAGSAATGSCRLVSFTEDGAYASGAGQVIGIAGRRGSWLDEVRAVCMRFSSVNGMAFWTGTAENANDAIGGRGAGGQPFQRLCPRDQAVVGMRGRADWYVDRIRIACRAVNDRGKPTGRTTWLDAAGGTGGHAFGPLKCAGNGVVRDIWGKGNEYVDNLGMTCDAFRFTWDDYR